MLATSTTCWATVIWLTSPWHVAQSTSARMCGLCLNCTIAFVGMTCTLRHTIGSPFPFAYCSMNFTTSGWSAAWRRWHDAHAAIAGRPACACVSAPSWHRLHSISFSICTEWLKAIGCGGGGGSSSEHPDTIAARAAIPSTMSRGRARRRSETRVPTP